MARHAGTAVEAEQGEQRAVAERLDAAVDLRAVQLEPAQRGERAEQLRQVEHHQVVQEGHGRAGGDDGASDGGGFVDVGAEGGALEE